MRLELLLASRDSLAIGVARHQLIVAGVATDPRNALLSDLARRLHRHRVATIRFEAGLGLQEIDELLGGLAGDPRADGSAMACGPTWAAGGPISAFSRPSSTGCFSRKTTTRPSAETPGGALWLGLAHLALVRRRRRAARTRRIRCSWRGRSTRSRSTWPTTAWCSTTWARWRTRCPAAQGAWEPRVRERVSRLVASLKPETLRACLEAGADHAERRQFALTASEVLAVDAVIEVVEAAASTTGQTISHQLLRLLHKFAHHAEHGPQRGRAEAESMLRRNVAQLITEWDLEDPNPSTYTAVLDGMTRQSPEDPSAVEDRLDCDPEVVLQIALEADCGGPRVYAALDAMVEERRLPPRSSCSAARPKDAAATAEALWRHVATPARLRVELTASRRDFLTIESLVRRLGPAATEPLLDMLEQAADQAVRARALRLLVAIGPSVAPAAAARLHRAPWYVQRNLLALLRMLRTWPSDFSAVTYARHPELRLRREAYKLLLDFPAHRASAIQHGLNDESPEIVTLVLRAAVDGCPPDAMRAIERFTDDWRRPAELRAIAVRALASGNGPQAMTRLLQLAGARRGFFGWRLEASSPVALAAVSALARHWAWHPQVIGLLKSARKHDDPEVRQAARMRFA